MRVPGEYMMLGLVLLALLCEEADTAVRAQNRNRLRRNRVANRLGTTARRRNNNIRNRATTNRNTAQTKKTSAVQPRIVGGTEANIANMPYLVQVRRGDSLCGGSLIDPQWVLTAAHCVSGASASEIVVRGGTSTLDGSDGVTSTVSYLAVPQVFKRSTMRRDAALLKLSTPLNGTNIATIPLGNGPRAGTMVRIAGWGYTSENGGVSTQVRTALVRVIRNMNCARRYKNTISITKAMFCASTKGKDACSGDSGGPVVQNGRVVGIVSFGVGCARRGAPGVYTRVGTVRQWIQNVMSNN